MESSRGVVRTLRLYYGIPSRKMDGETDDTAGFLPGVHCDQLYDDRHGCEYLFLASECARGRVRQWVVRGAEADEQCRIVCQRDMQALILDRSVADLPEAASADYIESDDENVAGSGHHHAGAVCVGAYDDTLRTAAQSAVRLSDLYCLCFDQFRVHLPDDLSVRFHADGISCAGAGDAAGILQGPRQ